MKTLIAIVAAVACAHSQDLTPAEKDFEQMLSGATLSGHFTRGEGGQLSKDEYVIEKVTKVKDDLWRFETRIRYGGKEVTAPLVLPVKWAGDTPVITLTDMTLPGLGTFTARVVLYRGQYAGLWSGKGHGGGQLFGRIVKSTAAGPQ
jgi:hypothetical protein